jgi:glutamine---fructose-6-phosphate transaminase (isomerizing)
MSPTAFERDIADQGAALRHFAHTEIPAGLSAVRPADFDRIVLTGMGSSHFAALPTWRQLVDAGLPAWWVDTGQLLDSPHLLADRTLLVATSQSGASGEIAALLRLPTRAGALIAVTNDGTSALARAADVLVGLTSGDEATVSTKSYLNTLAAHDRIAAALTGADSHDVLATALIVDHFEDAGALTLIADRLVAADNPRLAYVGFGDDAATALYAGLITKEGAKIAAEGYIGGQFRHGPLELAGAGLTAVLYGTDEPAATASLARLGADLLAAGSTVVCAAPATLPSPALHLPPPEGRLASLAHGALIAQHLTVALAQARGITPGAFLYGNKITTAL